MDPWLAERLSQFDVTSVVEKLVPDPHHLELKQSCPKLLAGLRVEFLEVDTQKLCPNCRGERFNSHAGGLPVLGSVWLMALLDLRPNCECCGRDLPPDQLRASISSTS